MFEKIKNFINSAVLTSAALNVDGIGGQQTVKRLQYFFDLKQDGVISGQDASLKKYRPSLTSVTTGTNGSATVRAIQKWLGISCDGQWGMQTSYALQKKLGVTPTGTFDKDSMKALQKYLNTHSKAYPKKTTTTSKASQINARALEYAWPVGTPESKYKKKGGSPCPAFKVAWKKYFPKKSMNTGCHSYVMLVLKACGYPTMPVSKGWSQILKYLRKNFTEIKVNYTQAQLKAGDIRVHKNAEGGYHIWIIVNQNGKFYRAEANQAGKNPRYAHINTSNSGNTKKHKGDWLFRAK